MSFLDLKNVTKIYPNGTKAVHETSLSIEEGEFMVFVGIGEGVRFHQLRVMN